MNSSEKDSIYYLEKAPVPRAIIHMAVPMIMGMILGLLYNLIDAYFIGRLGNTAMMAAAEKRDRVTEAVLRHLDPLRRKWFLKTLRWAQEAAPRREDCIGDLGLGYPLLRKIFAKLGRRFVTGGAIAAADDIYWLEESEVEALVASLEIGEPLPSLATQVEQRKVQWQRQHRAVVPPLLPEDSFLARMMKREHKGNGHLEGFGASGGRVTARACVLRDPSDFGQMQPGDVIVAVTTTPAWTPLFAIASAVVTEIGGPLSHSSIVAREYGIPAVLGTGVAIRRIRSGQTITVDGNAGTVTYQPFERNLPCEPASLA